MEGKTLFKLHSTYFSVQVLNREMGRNTKFARFFLHFPQFFDNTEGNNFLRAIEKQRAKSLASLEISINIFKIYKIIFTQKLS